MTPSQNPIEFAPRTCVQAVEEGLALAPRFDQQGLLPCITTDAESGEVLMLGYMNAEALTLTLRTAQAHYFSRTRQSVWHKGATSGLVQHVVDARVDDDQDAIWLKVRVAGNGASCHVGYRSCFYRQIPVGDAAGGELVFKEDSKVFDPLAVYGDAPNPTLL